MIGKKANVVLYVSFFIIAAVIIMIAAVIAPMGVTFSTHMYQAGENMLELSPVDQINNTEVQDTLKKSITNAQGASENNIEILANFYRYGWILVVGLVALILFLFTRMQVERVGGLY